MRVLVTGHLGYIGSVLTAVLQHARHEVYGLDCDLYAGCDFGRVRGQIEGFNCDLRRVEVADLLPFDAVIHLAGLPDDPGEWIDPALMDDVNAAGTLRLAHCCQQAGVSRFLFASTCAVYGRQGSQWLSEESLPQPLTGYARSKLLAEVGLSRLNSPAFRVTCLRIGTVYGVSPRLRLDTVVNDFVGAAVTGGRLVMKTQGWAWRPFIHIHDVARIILGLLENEQSRPPVLNIIHPDDNARIIDVADAIAESVPHCARFSATSIEDKLSYRVGSDHLQRLLPGFRFGYRLSDGIRQLCAAFDSAGLTHGEWRSDRYRRAMRLAWLQEGGELPLTPPQKITAA